MENKQITDQLHELSKAQQSNISTKNGEPQNLPNPIDKEIFEAFNSKKICEAAPIEIDKIIIPAVSKAFAYLGRKNDDSLSDQLKIIYAALPEQLLFNTPTLRLKEFEIALMRGIYKEYGDYYGLNIVEIIRFCKAYYNSENRANTIKSINKPMEQQKEKPPLNNRFDFEKKSLLICFEKNNTGGDFEVFAPSCYDFIDQLGLIGLSTPEKFKMLENAAYSVIGQCKTQMLKFTESFQRLPFQLIIDAIEQNLQNNKPMPDHVKAQLIAKSKFLSLKHWFNQFVSTESLETEIEDSKFLYIEKNG